MENIEKGVGRDATRVGLADHPTRPRVSAGTVLRSLLLLKGCLQSLSVSVIFLSDRSEWVEQHYYRAFGLVKRTTLGLWDLVVKKCPVSI